jgi:hypothetical protein
MPAIATQMFKIVAIKDFFTVDPDLLSFTNGQQFYALSTDAKRGMYFVSTHFATPFSRDSISGLVPINHL